MKEKITAILTLGCVFSLFFYYKVYSPSDVVLSKNSSATNEQIVQKLMNEITEEKYDDNLSESSEKDVLLEKINCSLEQNETDNMSFNDAFKYYRTCDGSDSFFAWNNNKYTTLIASEVELSNSSIALNKNEESSKIDKHHYDLQKEILGVSQSK